MYFLDEGMAREERARAGEDGEEVVSTVIQYTAGQWFGELSLIEPAPRAVTVRALDSTGNWVPPPDDRMATNTQREAGVRKGHSVRRDGGARCLVLHKKAMDTIDPTIAAQIAALGQSQYVIYGSSAPSKVDHSQDRRPQHLSDDQETTTKVPFLFGEMEVEASSRRLPLHGAICTATRPLPNVVRQRQAADSPVVASLREGECE
jgi:hypothetical protein